MEPTLNSAQVNREFRNTLAQKSTPSLQSMLQTHLITYTSTSRTLVAMTLHSGATNGTSMALVTMH